MAIAVVILFTSIQSQAETVMQKQAAEMARQFFNAANGQVMAEPTVVYNGRKLTTQSLFVPFYVYNFPSGGFVIISAENKAFPILGYNLKEKFNPDKMGEKEKALLRSYALDIERIRYDSRVPEEAIKAWNDFPGYIRNIISQPYRATDVLIPDSTVAETIERIAEGEDASLSSSIYTPEQWEDAIDQELDVRRNVMLGIYDRHDFLPTIVQGRKGDMYRLSLDKLNKSLYRLFATEFYSDGQVASLGNPKIIEDVPVIETPFKFYDEFIAETRAEREKEQLAIENVGQVSEPETIWLGGGHYIVRIPENIRRMNLYNVEGALLTQKTFSSSDTADIDLSIQPNGFYIALFEGESGRTYGIKLAR